MNIHYIPSSLSRRAITVWTAAVLFLGVLGGGIGFLYGQALSHEMSGQPREARLPIAGNRDIPAINTHDSLFPALARAAETIATAPITADTNQDMVRIPAISVTVPLALAATMEDDDVLAALNDGVALYPNGVNPGQPGLLFISGHSTGEPWQGLYRFAFLRINELQPGDVIHVDRRGTRYTYRVTGTRTIDPRVVPSIDASGDEARLSLMACWPLWSTRNRLLVDAEFVTQSPLTPVVDNT